MQKLLIYHIPENGIEFFNLLCSALPHSSQNIFNLFVANVTTHGLARLAQRGLSAAQASVIQSVYKHKLVNFDAEEVSEIKGIKLNEKDFVVTGIVLNDIVFAIHARNLTPELRQLGFGTYEGAGYGVIKTALSKPNVPQKWESIDGWKIVKKV